MDYLPASRVLPLHSSRAVNPLIFQKHSSFEPTLTGPQDALTREVNWGSSPATLGDSDAMQSLRSRVRRIAPYFRTALLSGPAGTEKAGVARMLHALCPARNAPFIPFQAAALAETLLQIGMRGIERLSSKAETHGTLFLHEICNVPPALQASLLAIWSPENRCKLRVIAGTHMDLRIMTATGRFRADLFQKLAGVEIALTPLSERPTDLASLAEAIVSRFRSGHGPVLSDDAIDRLMQHNWPGDHTELEGVLHSAFHRANGSPVIRPEHLPALTPEDGVDESVEKSDRLDEVVQRHVLAVLTRCRGNKLRAAEILGISRSTLYRMLESKVNPDFPSEDRDRP